MKVVVALFSLFVGQNGSIFIFAYGQNGLPHAFALAIMANGTVNCLAIRKPREF